MQEHDLTPLLQELGRLIQWAVHDGLYSFDKEPWQQGIDKLDALWQQLTQPRYIEALRQKLHDPQCNEDWRRLFNEALRRAEERATR